MNWVMTPLSAVPPEWLAVLEEHRANFVEVWSGLIAARAEASGRRDSKKVEQIDADISRMMVVNTGKVGDREIVGEITGGPNGFAIFREDFLADRTQVQAG